MDAILQSQVFFFISSIGFIFLWILAVIFLLYLIRVTNTLSKIMEKVDKDVNSVGDTTKEIVDEVKNSAIFNFIFKRKKHHEKK